MNKRVIALILSAALLCSPCTAYAAESGGALQIADSGAVITDSGMKDPGYYSAAYADYLLQVDNANAANGSPTKLWLSYMIKWKKAIPYKQTPANYVYKPHNPKARAATIPISSLPMGAKMVDTATAWYGEPLIWIKISNDVLQPKNMTDAQTSVPHLYSSDGNWSSYDKRYSVNSTKQLWVTEQSIARLPLDAQYGSLYYPNRSLREWLTLSREDTHYKIFGLNFLGSVISPNLKKYMMPSAPSQSLTLGRYWSEKDYDMYFDWVSLPPAAGQGYGYGENDSNGASCTGYQWPYFSNSCIATTKRAKTHKVFVGSKYPENNETTGKVGVDFPNRILTSSTRNSTDWYYADILGTDGYANKEYYISQKHTDYAEVPSGEIRPTIALRMDTQVYGTPDANGIYTLVGNLAPVDVTQSFSADTNRSTITAAATGATSMQITYGGAVVATASGDSITYAAANNGSYTAVGSNGSASLSAAISVSAIDDIAPVIINTAPAGGWAGSKNTAITLTDAKTPSGMQYNIGGGWVSYSAPFTHTFTASGSIIVMARDKWGNASGGKTITASQIDTTAPTAPSIAKSPASAWHRDNVSVTINGGSDVGSGINRYQYNINGGAWQNYGAAFAVASSAAVNARTVDNVGLVSGGNNIAVSIDRITPTGTITYNKAWTKNDVELRFTAADFGGSNVARVRAGAGGWVAGAATAQTVSANGSYSFTVEDNAGNSQTVTEAVACIDKALPVVNEINFIKTSDNLSRLRTLFNKQLEIDIKASDTASGIHTVEYQLVEKGAAIDAGAWLPYSAAIKPRVAKRFDGAVAARCTDVAENVSAVLQADVTVEDTPPTATHTLTPNAWTNQPVEISVTAADDASGVASIALPDGTVVQSDTASYTVAANGTYRFIVTDKCGNTLEYAVVVSNIDLTPPTSTPTLTPNTWTNQPVEIGVTAADDASGIASITLPDGTVVQSDTASYTVAANGKYRFAATDNAGNAYGYEVTVDKLDYIAPIVTGVELTSTDLPLVHAVLRMFSPSNFRTQVRIGASCTDDASGVESVEYQLVEQGNAINADTWRPYNAEDKPVIQKHFVGQIAVRCTDKAGTTSDIFYEDVIVEDTPPTATHTLTPDTWTNQSIEISVTAADAASGVASIALPDGAVVQSDTTSYTVAANGTYRFIVTDKCGNTLEYAVVVSNIDLTPPTSTPTLTPNTWTNQPVEISVTAADAASGIASITLPDGTVVQSDTASYTVAANGKYSFTATDNAGNAYGYEVTVDKLDYIAPIVTGVELTSTDLPLVHAALRMFSPSNFRTQVRVGASCTDDASGVASVEYQLVGQGNAVNADTWRPYNAEDKPVIQKHFVGQIAVRCTDKAGTISDVFYEDVIVEDTPPTATHTLTPNAWTNQPVEISVTAADAASGVASIALPDGTVVQSDTASYTVSINGTYRFVIADKCGNTLEYDVVVSNIDLTPPTSTPTLTPNTWTNQPVEISVTAADDASGIASITLPDGTVVQSDTASYTVAANGKYRFAATDNAGNAYGYEVTVDKLDKVKPGITGFTLHGISDSPIKSFMRCVFPSFFTTQVELLVTAEDDYSGVKTIEYQVTPRGAVLDSGNWRVYDSGKPPKLEKEAAATVAVRTTDNADNVSAVVSKDAVIDGSAPVGSHTLSTTEWCNTFVIITVKAQDHWTKPKHITLPDGKVVEGDTASFRVVRNGNYEFILTDELGNSGSYTVPIANIEEVYPTPPKLGVGDADEPTDEMYVPDDIELGWENNTIDVKSLAQSGIEKYQYTSTLREQPAPAPIPTEPTPAPVSRRARSAIAVKQWIDCGGEIIVNDEGIWDVEVRAVSYAGNISGISNYVLKNDYNPPRGTAKVSSNEISFTATDDLSGVAQISCEHDKTVTVTKGGEVTCKMTETETHIYTVTDNAGQAAEIPIEYIRPNDVVNVGGSEVPSEDIFVEGDEAPSIPLPLPNGNSEATEDNTAQGGTASGDNADSAGKTPPSKGGESGLDGNAADSTDKSGEGFLSQLLSFIKSLLERIIKLVQRFWIWFNSLPLALRVAIAVCWWLLVLLAIYYIYRKVKKAKTDKRVE